MKTHKNWMIALVTLTLTAGLWACGDDDDADAGGTDTDTDIDTDVDTDSDTDTDTDTEVTYDGTLQAQVQGVGVSVYDIVAEDLTISASLRYIASEGNCNNINLDAVRIYLADDTDPDPFWEGATEDFDVVTAEFDGVVMDNTDEYVDYVYQSGVQEGFNDHCNELFEAELEVSYNQGTVIDDLTWSGGSVQVICITE